MNCLRSGRGSCCWRCRLFPPSGVHKNASPFKWRARRDRRCPIFSFFSPSSSSHRAGCNFGGERRREGYVKRGSPDAFLKWGSGPQPRRAKRSRAGDERGVKEMAVNNKVAAAGRTLHPRHAREREPNLRVLRRGEVLSNMHGQGQALQSFHL